MQRLLAMVLLSLVVCGMAASQPPSGSDAPSNQTTQPTASDQRGTEQAPLVVKTLPAEKTHEVAEQEERERKEKAEIDRKIAFETQRIADYTFWLSVFTAFLFCIAVGQALLFVWQLLYMREGMTDAKKAAEFSAIGAAAAKEAAEAAKLQADAIIKAERPFVVLRITDPGMKMQPDGRLDVSGMSFKFGLVNYGKTPASIVELAECYVVKTSVTDVPEPIDPMKQRGKLLADNVISAPGAPFELKTNLMNHIDVERLSLPNAFKNTKLYYQGFFRYSDAFGASYVAGFFYVFRPEHDTWEQRGDRRYNYTRIEKREDIPRHPSYPIEEQRRD